MALFVGGGSAAAQTPAPGSPSPLADRARELADSQASALEPGRPDAADPPPQEPARTRTRLQIGAALKSTTTPGIDSTDSFNPTFVWRWRGKGSRTDDRWAPAYRLSSFSSRISAQLGARELPVGDVKVRPLMVGLDYKMPRGKWNWSAGLSAGWAMNNIDTPSSYHEEAAATARVPDLWVDVHNSFVWGPRLKGWYDVNRRLSYMVETAYLVTRPEVDLRANGVVTTRRLNADAFILKAGVVYGIF